jgi:signal transduction histidine kinase
MVANLSLKNSVCPSFVGNISPLIVSIGFWLVGLFAWYSRQKSTTSVYYLLISGVLSSGLLSSMRIDWGGRVFFILLAWLAPFTARFHKALSGKELTASDRISILFLYLLATLWSFPWVFLKPTVLENQGYLDHVDAAIRVTLVLSIILAFWVAIRDYRGLRFPAVKRKLRLVIFGAVLGFPPFIFLSLLPETLDGRYYAPYSSTFPFLLLGPLFFLYSIYQSRLVHFERIVLRVVAYYLLSVIVISLTIFSLDILIRWNGSFDPETQIWIWIVAITSFSCLSIPIWTKFNDLAYWAFYGDRKRYAGWIEWMAASLSNVLDSKDFCQIIFRELSNLFPISGCAIYLRNQNDQLACMDVEGMDQDEFAESNLLEGGAIANCLKKYKRPLDTQQLIKGIKGKEITLREDEQRLLYSKSIEIWLPLLSENKLQGLVLLSPGQPDNYLTDEDRTLLQSFIFQGGIAANNLYLGQEVLRGKQELNRAYQELLSMREQERRRLAYELHDEVLQDLLGISYKLAEVGKSFSPYRTTKREMKCLMQDAHRGILQVILRLRKVFAGLRPAGLDVFGLTSAIESHVQQINLENCDEPPEIVLDLDPIGPSIPETVSISLFRVVQEGLQNALKHACARRIRISLKHRGSDLCAIIEDDGVGFSRPERLSKLTWNNYFGIVAMEDYMTWAGGSLDIDTRPGGGTKVIANVPLIHQGGSINEDNSDPDS